MKIYRGLRVWGQCQVIVDGKHLPPRLDLMNHSPTGFEWGYGGSGPAQLALAILADCLGDDVALENYQSFKWDVVSKLPREEWELEETQIRDWLSRGHQEQLFTGDL